MESGLQLKAGAGLICWQAAKRFSFAMTSDTTFLEKFETAALPLEEWHHQQHLKVAYLYLRNHPFPEALARMRAGIKAYNTVHRVPDTELSGYHETMTQAWLRLVDFTCINMVRPKTRRTFTNSTRNCRARKPCGCFIRRMYSRRRKPR